jgi:hypothetical protein
MPLFNELVSRMTIDDSISQFRIASRELFNTYFRIADPYNNDDAWALSERFSQVESVLFDQLVAAPGSLPFGAYGTHQPNILVLLRGLDFAPIMINREVDTEYWDHPIVEITKDAQLSFVRFFDWDVLAVRDYQYVRVRIDAWSAHPEVIGNHALIEARSVAFDQA